jgi:hypothetical protein
MLARCSFKAKATSAPVLLTTFIIRIYSRETLRLMSQFWTSTASKSVLACPEPKIEARTYFNPTILPYPGSLKYERDRKQAPKPLKINSSWSKPKKKRRGTAKFSEVPVSNKLSPKKISEERSNLNYSPREKHEPYIFGKPQMYSGKDLPEKGSSSKKVVKR